MEERVIKILNDVNEDICQYQGSALWEDKVIDSFEVMEIISGLEEEFKIEIDAENVVLENFANAQAIIQMMKKCLNLSS